MYFTGVIAIVGLFMPWGESQVSLRRTSPPGTLSACPNTAAVFTCGVTDSSTIVWTSEEYIGENGAELVFTFSSEIGSNETVNDVVAILSHKSDDLLELESQLHVRIHASAGSSIGCHPDNADDGKTVEVTVYNNDSPGKPMNISVEKDPDSCAILVDWDPPTDTPPEDISHYIIRDSINGVQNETITSTLVTFPFDECTGNRFVIISITTVDRCEQEGPSSANVEVSLSTDPGIDTTTSSSTQSTTTTTDTPSSPGTHVGEILGGVLGSVSGVALIGVVAAVLIYCYCKRTKGETGAKSESLTEDEIAREDKKDGVLSEHIDITMPIGGNEAAMSSGPPPPPGLQTRSGLRYRGGAAGSKKPQRDLSEVAEGISKDDVGMFLRQIELAEYVTLFSENDIDGEMLIDLDQEYLKDLGITNTFHQKKIIRKFQSYLQDKLSN